MYVQTDLSRKPPIVSLNRNPFDSDEEPLWCLEIWPVENYGGECVCFLADSLEAVAALGREILEAVEQQHILEQLASPAVAPDGGG